MAGCRAAAAPTTRSLALAAASRGKKSQCPSNSSTISTGSSGSRSSSRSTSTPFALASHTQECGLCDLRRTITTSTRPSTARVVEGSARVASSPSSSPRPPTTLLATSPSSAQRFASSSSSSSSSASAAGVTPTPNTTPRSTPPTRPSALIRPVRIVPPRLTTPNSTVYKQRRAATRRGQAKPLTATEREQELAKLYALKSVPPTSALAALANRISPLLFGSKRADGGAGVEEILKKIEQCCTCESFWQVVDEHDANLADPAQQGGGTVDIARASDGHPAPFTNYLDQGRLHNESLSVLGNNLLGVFALEWLESRYPHLPERAMKAALTLYVGPRTCADIATKQWGINSGQASRQAFLPLETGPSAISPSHKPGQPLRGAGEGNRAGTGLLRWGRSEASKTKETLEALYERSSNSSSHGLSNKTDDNRTPLPLEEALASATRAIVGLVFQEHGFAAARTFVHDTFLTRQADITSLLKFSNPKYTLSATLAKYNRPAPVTRLIAETGRLSIAPIFVTGVYSDRSKLGEGYGSSLQMAEYRACEDALRRIYLSPLASPAEAIDDAASANPSSSSKAKATKAPSDALELPSDTLVYPGRKLRFTRQLADDEVLWQSSGRSGGLAA